MGVLLLSGETRNYISMRKERSRLWDRSLGTHRRRKNEDSQKRKSSEEKQEEREAKRRKEEELKKIDGLRESIKELDERESKAFEMVQSACAFLEEGN